MKRFATVFLTLLACALATRAQNHLQKGDFVAVCGDSITEQKLYSVYIEDYLLMCKPQPDLRVMQFGWSGETSWGFLSKMPNEALRFDMTVATTCYGMNDGQYSPMNEQKAQKYRDAMQGIVSAFKQKGVRFIVVGSPGAVDTDTFKQPDPNDPEKDPRKKKRIPRADMYNPTLAALRDIAKDVAQKNGCAFANVHDTMIDAMAKAKAKYGPQYHVAGGDGVHPQPNGQLCMAYAFLKGLGVDGNIGTITVDLSANKAQATDGHKVLGMKDGEVEIESTRYPFCFYGDPKSPGATSGIIEFLPFNQDLNRYTLVVKGATGKVKVTWGKDSKEFAAADAEKGINLPAEFPTDNPFSEPFKRVEDVIKKQQNFETPLVKKTLHDLPKAKDKEQAERTAQDEIKRAKELFDDSQRAAAAPVKHTIKIEIVK
ncbi:MAG TPA: SGNH/GDSL hydrolase family protein [Tepidisphaeraceae bacterium]|jgi:lysophospholipase L1-like esterase